MIVFLWFFISFFLAEAKSHILDRYLPCCTSKTPPNGGLAKLLEVCPFTGTMNLAFTVIKYLEYSDKVSWNNKTLLQSILSLLKQHKQDLHTKRSFQFLQALTQVCHRTSEVTACRDYLSKFFRNPGQRFVDLIIIFESVYGHWQKLLRPQHFRLETDYTVSGV